MTEEVIEFADCEGDNFLDDITKLWTIQIAEGEDGEITVYADQPGYPSIQEGLLRLSKADKVAFHNAFGFDFFAINKLHPGTLKRTQIIDTLLISRLMNPSAKRHNLGDLGESLGYPKGDFHDFSKFTPEMATYGKQDVKILQQAWKGEHKKKGKKVRSFGKYYRKYRRALELEFHTAYVIEKQRQHGFRFNLQEAYELEAELRQEITNIERELQEIFPPIVTERYSDKQKDKKTGKPKRLKDHVEVFNPGSRPQIEKRLKDRYGWKPTKKTPTGRAEINETVLSELDYPEAEPLKRYLTVVKMLGQLSDGDNAWIKLYQTDSNGDARMHGSINVIGARTGRMAHWKPNMGQVSKKDKRMREVWLPDRDHVLIGIDADGLELRELAHFLYPYDGGVYARAVHEGKKEDETDVHNMNKKAAGLYLRDSAKTMIYAHNYGCGDAKLGKIVLDDLRNAKANYIPDKSKSAIGEELRGKLEDGVAGLQDLINKCKRGHNKKEALPGHDGRSIPSASAHSALNTLLQGNGSIVMKKFQTLMDEELERLQIIDQVGWIRKGQQAAFCATVHDEVQISAHPDVADKIGEVGHWAMKRAGELLEVRIPLVASVDVGANWKETH